MDTFEPNHTPNHAFFLLGVKVILVNTEGNILFLRRSDKVSRPHGWDLPGGGVDKGESPQNAALREVKEETGLEVSNLRILTTYLINTDKQDDLIIGYVADVEDEVVKIIGWEHEDSRWVSLDELGELDLPPEHTAILEAYNKQK